MLTLNKTIAFTKSWIKTLWIGVILGGFLAMLIVFLKPFDTGVDQMPYLTVKLLGYALCFIFPIIIVHILENYIYKKQRNRWFLTNEIVYIAFSFFLVVSCCYLYHWIVISEKAQLELSEWIGFITQYGLPFSPILIPFWVYVRAKFGVIEISSTQKISEETITISGDNKTESLTLATSAFVYAQSQQNYVTIFYTSDLPAGQARTGLQQKMLRSTLSNLNKQLPNARQVHRSYLVNLDYLKSVEGNARKRFMNLTVSENPIPVSQKYFEALQKHISNSSQKLHE